MQVYVLIRCGVKSMSAVLNEYVIPGIETLRDESMYDECDIDYIEEKANEELYEAYSYFEDESIKYLQKRINAEIENIKSCHISYFGEICQLFIETESENPQDDAEMIVPLIESSARAFRRFILYAARSPLTKDALRGLRKECELRISVTEADISTPIELLDVIQYEDDTKDL